MLFTFPPMIRGSHMEILSWRTRVGTQCPEFFMKARDYTLALDLESDSSEGLAGAGITGTMTGTDGTRTTTTTPTSRTAVRSSTEITSMLTAAISTTAMHST